MMYSGPNWDEEPDVARLREARVLLKHDFARGLSELKDLAEHGSLMSMVYIAWAYNKGDGIEPSFEQAVLWYKRAVMAGSSLASFHLGMIYYERGDFSQALCAFNLGADRDFPPSVYRLGQMYYKGQGVQADTKKAFLLWERSSKMGHIFAKRNVALSMIKGKFGIFKIPLGIIFYISNLYNFLNLSIREPDSYLLR